MSAITAFSQSPGTRASSLSRKLREEPYRLFFPLAALAGLFGVALWPLHLHGWWEWYPGTAHVRLMTNGFFLGFIMGFLGTALPKLLNAPALKGGEFLLWTTASILMITGYATGTTGLGDLCATAVFVLLISFAIRRMKSRRDLPPPGFVLAGLGLICGLAAAVLGIVSVDTELGPQWMTLQRLLSSQGLVLLPVLGVGGFMLPRFFGMFNRQDFPESRDPVPRWIREAALATVTGVMLIATFALEAMGRTQLACLVRSIVAAAYLWHNVPFWRRTTSGNSVSWILKLALALTLLGLVLVSLLPHLRLAALHATFVGGIAIITFMVALRVVFGHAGQPQQLQRRHRRIWFALSLMLLGMLSRMVGDMLPHIMASHYNYGALCWMAGVVVWAWIALPPLCRFPVDVE